MKRSRRCDAAKQAHWQEVVRRWKQSGQSVRAYCHAEGVKETAFFWWRRELARRAQKTNADQQPVVSPSRCEQVVAIPGQASGVDSEHPRFLPVRVTMERQPEHADGIEIALGHGRTIRVPPRFDRQTLVDVLAVLEGRPC